MNRQRILRLVAAGAAAAVSMTTLALVQAPAAQAASLCQSDCIGTVTAAAGLDQVRLQFATTANTKVSLQIRRADGTGSATNWGSATFTNSFDVAFSALTSGIQYRYQIVATDYSGGSWQETGYFATSQRRITVTPTKLTIDDDSDSFSAGDLVGAVHLYGACAGDVRALSPLSKTSTTQVNSGASLTVGAGATITCDKVPASVSLETYLADNDVDSGDSCASWWPWTFPSTSWSANYGSNTCADWNYGSSTHTFPLAASLPTGSTTVNFTHKSTQKTWDGWTLALRWTLAGTVTFSHVKPAGALPATTTGSVSTQVATSPSDASMLVTWQPVVIPGVTVSGYRLSYRTAGGSWTAKDLSAATLNQNLTGLTNGTPYEVKVSALDSAKTQYGLDEASGTPVASVQPTTVTGWSTGGVLQAAGTTVPVPVTVSSGGVPRTVSLQSRQQGSASWATYWTGSTDAAGNVTLSLPVNVGINEHRLTAAATATHTNVSTAARALTSTTSLNGFDTTSVSAIIGASVPASVTVTPGSGRELALLRRTPGGAWQTAEQFVVDADGLASFSLPVVSGTVEWAVQAAATPQFGAGALSGVRSVTGTAALITTVVSGWTTAPAVLPVGTVISTPITVTTTATVRTLRLQYLLPGTSVWKTHLTKQAEPNGKATLTYPVKPGRVAWRVVVDATSEHAGRVTSARSITAKTVISGFATTAITRTVGTIISDAILVKPGSKRTVLVQYRKVGTTTWKTYRKQVASGTGALTVTLKALTGRHAWRVYVPATLKHGAAASSGLRTVVGR